MTDSQKAKLIAKYGKCLRKGSGRITGRYATVCQGCGKWILSTDWLDDVEVIVTKRKDGYFYHKPCFREIRNGKIRYV